MKSTLLAWISWLVLSTGICAQDISHLKEWDAVIQQPDGSIKVIDCSRSNNKICELTWTDINLILED